VADAVQARVVPGGAVPARSRKAWLVLFVAAGFGAVLISPYVLLDMHSSRVAVSSEAHYDVLVVHMFAACIALVLGPWQFIPWIRARRRLHRTIGRVYLMVGVVPAAIAAVPVALLSGRLLTAIGLTIPAVLWLVTGALAYRAVRRQDYSSHQDWMTRNYALTFLAVTSRILVPVLLLGGIAFAGANVSAVRHDATSMIPVGQLLGWMVNLVVAEILIRRRHARAAVGGRGPAPITASASDPAAGGDAVCAKRIEEG